jgi:hypothetical protein
MKKFLLIIGFVLFSNIGFSQIGGEDEVYLVGDFIYDKFKNLVLEKF